MKTYELLALIKPGLDQESLNSLYKVIEEIVAKYKGEIENREEWGKKPLAYNIQKNREGVYSLFHIKLDPAAVKGLDKDLKLNEHILRVSFTQKKEKKHSQVPKE